MYYYLHLPYYIAIPHELTTVPSGHVGISARHSNQFRVSVNAAARSGVAFFLLYEELLRRRGGIYRHAVNITPRQKLAEFSIKVQVRESRNLTYLHVPPLSRHQLTSVDASSSSSSSDGPLGTHVHRPSSSSAVVTYRPPLKHLQERLRSRHALQFAVEYDVQRVGKGGEVQARLRSHWSADIIRVLVISTIAYCSFIK